MHARHHGCSRKLCCCCRLQGSQHLQLTACLLVCIERAGNNHRWLSALLSLDGQVKRDFPAGCLRVLLQAIAKRVIVAVRVRRCRIGIEAVAHIKLGQTHIKPAGGSGRHKALGQQYMMSGSYCTVIVSQHGVLGTVWQSCILCMRGKYFTMQTQNCACFCSCDRDCRF